VVLLLFDDLVLLGQSLSFLGERLFKALEQEALCVLIYPIY
jgi:hypothetical protein